MQNLKTALKKEENWTLDKINGLMSLKNQVVHAAFVSLNPNLEKEYDNIVDLVWKVGHYRMIEEFRKKLKFQKKMVNSFRVFLADATKFYLFWIKGWARAYALERVQDVVVSRLDVYDSDYGPDFTLSPVALSPELQDKVSKTIHRSLIYLGDLARYRELHVPINGKREKLWSLARNFYTLAIWLFPENGNPFNQLAVIESYEGNEMGALDYYFKSLSVTTPFSTGFDNVVVLLKKISAREISSQQQSTSHYLILMHSALLIEKSIEKFSQYKMSFLKEIYQDLLKGNMINTRFLKSIWSHSALQSLGGQDGKFRQMVLWDISFEIIGMVLKYIIEGQHKLDIGFTAIKLYLRFLFSYLDDEGVVDAFKDNIRPLIISYFNRFTSEYSYLFQEQLNFELTRDDIENIGWLLYVNDQMSSFWTLDRLNENPMEEKRVRENQILFLGLQLEKYPKLGVSIIKDREIVHFVISGAGGQENVTPESMEEDVTVHPVLSSILQKMDDESEDREILVYKGRQAQSKRPHSPSNFWSSSFKSDSVVKDSKSFNETQMSGNVKALPPVEMAQDLPSDGVNTMSFLGLVSSPNGNRQCAPFATPSGSLRQTFSMPPLHQTPSDFFGSPMGNNAMRAAPVSSQISDNNSGFSIPPPPGFTRFGQQPQRSPHSSTNLDSPWSKQIISSPLINPSILVSPGPIPPIISDDQSSHHPVNGPVSPWLNAGVLNGLAGSSITNTSNVFQYVRPPSESSPAWFDQAQNQYNLEDHQRNQKLFNPPPQSYTRCLWQSGETFVNKRQAMKDKDSYFRGACNSCDCQEYANDGGIKCADCSCPASRHKLTYWTTTKMTSTAPSLKTTKYSLKQLNPFNWISFQWLSYLNPFTWIALTWISIWGIRMPRIAFNSGKKPEKKKNNYLIDRVEGIPTFVSSLFADYRYPELWADFVKSIPDLTKMPNIDAKLQVVQKFQRRLPLGLASLGAIFVLGILGFRGSHLNFQILHSLYSSTMTCLVIGALFSYHIYLSSESIQKRTLAVVLFGMNSFSVLVYFLLYLGITPKLYGPLGIPIQTVRFIDWNLSIPCILEISSLLTTGKPADSKLDSKIQGFILSLLISSGQLTPLCEILGGFGIFMIGTILLDLANQFSSILESKSSNHKTLTYIRSLLFWSLSLIASTWILGLFTVFGFPESELFYSLTDAGFKCGFSALVLSLDKVEKGAIA